MTLADRVHIARRFQRSIRIDSDFADPRALEGFICPPSSQGVLLTMARHVSETGQGAFTWTGPYGSGKSSLAVALSALLDGREELKEQMSQIFDPELTKEMSRALPRGKKGWRVVPVVGRRGSPAKVIGEAVRASRLVKRNPNGEWTEDRLVEVVCRAASVKKRGGRVCLLIDEMGKFLEAAAQDNEDIYIFQQLAEAASRSKGRLLVVGILHQAFEEYANSLSREMRDEWAKIQGRFVDLAVNASGDEQIELIARAVESDHEAKEPSPLASETAKLVYPTQQENAERLSKTLENCWPLHPAVACLLGPISRRRFGQNQRSIFGFLNSSEPQGFQDFLRRASKDDLYRPDRLWDYLRANLEPSILASPDGHRWALAAEALERCESLGGDALQIQVLKTIAVLDLFKERSGLSASPRLLRLCLADSDRKGLDEVLEKLSAWSLIILKRFQEAYSIFAGSDFDFDEAVGSALDSIQAVDFRTLKPLAGLQPILAKRHYHETGSLRWFDVNLAPLDAIVETASRFKAKSGTVGQFLLAIPGDGDDQATAEELCRKAARESDPFDIVVGLSPRAWRIIPLARELLALEKVRRDRSELQGDAVARREIRSRLSELQARIEAELRSAFDSALWYRKYARNPKSYRHAELNSLASDLADRRFPKSPCLHNELLNRQKPSSSAVAAQNELMRSMVLNQGQPRLGIDGFPAEGGLFASLLEATGLYAETRDGWRLVSPGRTGDDPNRLIPIWEAAIEHVESNSGRIVTVSEIYEVWRREPFGVKEGMMPLLAVAFIESQRDTLAVYREGVFRPTFDDVDVQYLAKDAKAIQLRWMDLPAMSRRLLSEMVGIVRDLGPEKCLAHLEPIDVARGLVSLYERLPPCTQRTMRLSSNAIHIRDLFKRAKDPNKFLFDDLPATLGSDSKLDERDALKKVVRRVRGGLEELINAFPTMLEQLRDLTLRELQVPNTSPQSLAELRARAENIRQLAGDFRLEAFVGRLSQFDGSEAAFEGIASLAANKPPSNWVDPDLDRASVELADMAQRFLRAETFARVKGRPSKRHAMAMVIGNEGRPKPILEEFEVADSDRAAVDELITRVEAALETADKSRQNLILAALAEISARYIESTPRLTVVEKEKVS